VVVGDKLFIFGGFGGGTGRLDDFWSYDFATSTWSEVPVVSHSKPGCRENNGVVISDSSRFIYLFGGYNGQTWLNDLWKYDIETQMWSCLQESSGETGQQHQQQPHDHHHNNNDNNNNNNNNAGESGAPAAGGAGITPLRGPSRRFGYVSVVHQNTLIVWGGFDGIRWLNDLHRFDFTTARWEQLRQDETMIPSPRSCPAWAKEGSCVYITGGYDGVERKSDFFCLDLDTIEWTPLQCYGTPPSPRYFHSCWLYNSKLFCYAGYSGTERLADMFAFDLETQHWSLIESSNPPGDPNIPTGRSSLVAQYVSNFTIVSYRISSTHSIPTFFSSFLFSF
jgi:leucine-zipper-like transcriptional regulator 1